MNPSSNNERAKQPYVAPTVSRVIVDPLMEMLVPCSGSPTKATVGAGCTGTLQS